MKSTVSLLLAVLLLIFASQNMHETPIRFIVGPSVTLPLILILAGAFIAGFALATFSQLVRKSGRNRFHNDD